MLIVVFSILKNSNNINKVEVGKTTKTMTYEQQEVTAEAKVEGNKEENTEKNNEIMGLAESQSFKLTKTDAETGELLPNTKFVIYNIDGEEEPARDINGELVGTEEIINGKKYNVVTTDGNGEITVELPQGLYKAVEVKASDDKYALADATYFGIGKSRDAMPNIKWGTSIGEDKAEGLLSVEATQDGGYIVGGDFQSSSIQVGEYTLTNKDTSGRTSDGMLIKYNDKGEVQWATSVGGGKR